MTTASSMAFATMEVPIADDTMEMASPLPGHDDFEIDLDVMEDQASNADKDMMGADDYPAGDEIDVDYQRDGANDADMIDDVAEPTMVDADDQYPETNDNEMQYAPEDSYEAEMEDEYAEDSDVPMPKVNEQDSVSREEESTPKAEGAVEPAQTNGVVEEIKEPQPSSLEPTVESKSENVTQAVEVPQINLEEHDSHESEKVAEEAGLDQQKAEQAEHEVPPAVQAGPERDASHVAQPDADETDEKVLKQAKEHGETAETQPSVDHPEAQVPVPSEEKDDHVTQNQEQRTGLHPVKVYYQDNEISLFPPREGDASETYFLGDESLAYEHFGKLFESFREILQDHISDNDILVIDIDSMNIQLTEDSLHLSKVTLHQIVNLYLHLCDNESIGEPETLYLSLSTKLTIPALLSDIQAAANDGKGLSEIFWDDYDEAAQAEDHAEGQPDQKSEQDVSTNLPEPQAQEPKEPEEPEEHHDHEEHEQEHEHEAPTSSSVEAPQVERQEVPEEHKGPEAPATAEEDIDKDQEYHEHESQQEQEQSKKADFGVPEQNASYGEEEKEEGEGDEDEALAGEDVSSGEHGEEDVAPAGENENGEEFEEGEYADEFQQYDEPENEEQKQAQTVVDQPFEPEEQKTESTATLTPLPAQDATDNQQGADEPANVSQAEHDGEDDGAGEQSNGETNPDAPEETEYVDDLEFHGTDDAYEEELQQEPSLESQEPGLADEDAQDPASHQDAAAGEASKEDLNGILQEPTESTAEDGVPDVAEDYNQGTAENPAEVPGEEDSNNINTLGDGEDHSYDDSGEGWDKTEGVSSTNVNDYGVEGEGAGLDEFLHIDFDAEFGTAEEIGVSEAVAGDHVSTKRTREPEDETDPTETPTPDVKRTRSS